MQYTEVMDRIDGRLGPQYTLDQFVQHPPHPPQLLLHGQANGLAS